MRDIRLAVNDGGEVGDRGRVVRVRPLISLHLQVTICRVFGTQQGGNTAVRVFERRIIYFRQQDDGQTAGRVACVLRLRPSQEGQFSSAPGSPPASKPHFRAERFRTS